MAVYFIRAGETEPVKIGWAKDVEGRRRNLQTSHSEPLRVIRTIETGRSAERWLHRRFAARRINGEWFTFCEEMLTVQPEAPSKPKRWHLLPSKTCVYCCSAKPPTISSVCADCTAVFKRLHGLSDPERERGFREFFKTMEGRVLTPARKRGLMPVYRLVDDRRSAA